MTAPTWEQLVLPPFQRRSDTSREAALSMYGAPTAECRRMVLEVIRSLGPITDERIALATGLNPSTARPCRIELVESGAVVEAGTTRNRSGRKAKRWACAPVVVVLDEGPA